MSAKNSAENGEKAKIEFSFILHDLKRCGGLYLLSTILLFLFVIEIYLRYHFSYFGYPESIVTPLVLITSVECLITLVIGSISILRKFFGIRVLATNSESAMSVVKSYQSLFSEFNPFSPNPILPWRKILIMGVYLVFLLTPELIVGGSRDDIPYRIDVEFMFSTFTILVLLEFLFTVKVFVSNWHDRRGPSIALRDCGSIIVSYVMLGASLSLLSGYSYIIYDAEVLLTLLQVVIYLSVGLGLLAIYFFVSVLTRDPYSYVH